MAYYRLFYEGSQLVIHAQGSLQLVIKLCSIRNRVFLLGIDGELFFGDLDLLLEPPALELTFVRHGVIDVSCDSEMVYLVEETGRVWHTKAFSSLSEETWKELVILNDLTCPHGQRNTTERAQIYRVTCNNDGVLLTTTSRELYGMGDFNEEILSSSDIPQRIECFRGLKILQVAAGNNFVVVLTQKKRQKQHKQKHEASLSSIQVDYDTISMDSAASEVHINSECPKCCPERDGGNKMFLTPGHLQSIENNISKSTTETSIASSPSEENPFEEDLPNNNKSTPVKKTKDSALNFFLDLSQQQTKLLTENVTKNITMLSEGGKSLLRHMSGSDNTDSTLVTTAVDTVNEEKEKDDDEREVAEIQKSHEKERKRANNSQITQLQEKPGDESMEPSEASNSLIDLGSATDLHSDFLGGIENRITKLTRLGSNLIDTDVWCFGSVNKGHLGTGDHIKRTCINSVLPLSGLGVAKIECGA